jgi:uncharacterized coiled-coil protein SlyX
MSDLPLTILPGVLLSRHIDQTSARLEDLIQRVENVENQVVNSSRIADFSPLIRDLHACDADLMKLERRWNFEKTLAATLADIIGQYKKPSINSKQVQINDLTARDKASVYVNIGHDTVAAPSMPIDPMVGQDMKAFMLLDSDISLQGQRSRGSDYDIKVLPRRIRNQFTAVGRMATPKALRCLKYMQLIPSQGL